MHMFPFPPRWTARRSAASCAFARARTPSNYEQNRWASARVVWAGAGTMQRGWFISSPPFSRAAGTEG